MFRFTESRGPVPLGLAGPLRLGRLIAHRHG